MDTRITMVRLISLKTPTLLFLFRIHTNIPGWAYKAFEFDSRVKSAVVGLTASNGRRIIPGNAGIIKHET